MAISIHCTCGKVFEAHDAQAGAKAHCPGCNKLLDVPLQDDVPPVQAPPPVQRRPATSPHPQARPASSIPPPSFLIPVAPKFPTGNLPPKSPPPKTSSPRTPPRNQPSRSGGGISRDTAIFPAVMVGGGFGCCGAGAFSQFLPIFGGFIEMSIAEPFSRARLHLFPIHALVLVPLCGIFMGFVVWWIRGR